MEQLVILGAIVVLSILDSLARRRRAAAPPDRGGAEPEAERFPWAQKAPWDDDVPVYDGDPSYDDRAGAGAPEPPRVGPDRAGGPLGEGRVPSAAEILAELTGEAAEGRGKERERRIRQQSPPLPPPGSPIRRSSIARTEEDAYGTEIPDAPVPGAGAPEHAIHLSHTGYGTDPSERAPSEYRALATPLSESARNVRRDLRSGRDALRRAVILQEVLGPPLGLRDGPAGPRAG